MSQPRKNMTALLMALTLAGSLGVAPIVTAAPPAAEYATPEQGTMELSLGSIAPIKAVAGKSFILRTGKLSLKRISVSDPSVLDYTLLSPTELYMLPKRYGSTNITLWTKDDKTAVIDLNVEMDTAELEAKLAELLPDENGIKVVTAAKSIVLTGAVSNAVAASQAVDIAEAYVRYINRDLVMPIVAGGGEVGAGTKISVGSGASINQASKVAGVSVINMLRVTEPMQVLLEVKVAEVSKGLIDKLGTSFNATNTAGENSASLLTTLLATATTGTIGGLLTLNGPNGSKIEINAEKGDNVLRLLAEPNIMAISGQEGSFLSGGTVFVNGEVNQFGVSSLVEKEFGVRLRFLPTVLANGRINLKVEPEVSEPSDAFTGDRVSFTTRKASTTVQLNDGQSFAIAGLIKNNVTETVRRIPVLGEIPILGALFRSSDFQEGKTELMFVVTPRLVKPLPPSYRLPTDNYKAPGRAEFFLEGRMESATPPAAPAPAKANPDSLRMN